mmetsp:Transcript_6575/g.13974  ORF Transcript_6575/g.13974 Transcript_6575/m.13974 type:complete len:507 (-) Transcript_6575:134-1654(-)
MTQSASSSLAFVPLAQTKKFPYKLHGMMKYAERNSMDDIVSWMPGGKAFCVHKKELFCEQVLLIAFGDSSYKSFEKQLKNWSFQCDDIEIGKVYSNPSFMRGRKSLCIDWFSKNTKTKSTPIKSNYGATMATTSNNISIMKGTESTKMASLVSMAAEIEEGARFAMTKELETGHTVANVSTTRAASLRAVLLGKKNNLTLEKSSTVLPTNIPYEAASTSTVGQKRPWEMTFRPQSGTDLRTARSQNSQIADYTGEFVQRRDSGITSCLRRSQDKRPSSENFLGALREDQVDARNAIQGTLPFDEAVVSRFLRSASQNLSRPDPLLNATGAKRSRPYDIDSDRLSNYNRFTLVNQLKDPLSPSPGPPEASNLLRMMETLEEEKKKQQILTMHSNSYIADDSSSVLSNEMNIVDTHIKQLSSPLPNAVDKILSYLEEKRKLQIKEQDLLDQLEQEREQQKTLQMMFAERQLKSALLLQQQEAAILADKERDQTLSALLSLRTQRPPPL